MVGSSSSVHIGVIAEEKNDVEVLYELTTKLVKESSFKFSHFVGHGCGKLRRKCGAWGENLLQRGCKLLVVLHDRDGNDETVITATLKKQITALGFDKWIVVIPTEELEAWLLCDADALKQVFRMGKRPTTPRHPETISDPKSHLGKIIRDNSKTQYLNTVHNRRIAAAMQIKSLTRCPSFSDYPNILQQVFPSSALLGTKKKTKKEQRKRRK